MQHWRHHKFNDIRPFFCQIEAVETVIWLTEVAPHFVAGKSILKHLAAANRDANPELQRLALKLATGAGNTIKDRLRVLQPNDPDSYYESRELVPQDLLEEVRRAKIVITNFHAFMLRERLEISKGGRALLQGRTGTEIETTETEGQMIQRVIPELMGMKNILILNDEAHHCYREKPGDKDDEDLKGEDKKEAEKTMRRRASGFQASKP